MSDALFTYDIFKEYQTEFLKLTETKNRKKKKYYKDLSKEEKEALEKKELIKYIKLIEKDKFYYYALAYKNSTDVVIVKSPSNNNENKKFLGYEWSTAKGNEGIHYITKSSINIDDESLEEEDKRILENLQGLKNINTPLYNPKDIEDKSKINTIIANNFAGIKTTIPTELESFVSRAKLVDMLDFSRVDFNKALNLSPNKKIEIESKYPFIKLGEFAEIIAGQSPQGEYYNEDEKGLAFYQGKKDFGEIYLNNPVVWTSKTTKESFKNDLLMSVRAPVGDVNLNPFDKICIGRGLAIIRTTELKTQKYLFEFIHINKEIFKGNTGTTFESISTADLRNIKIPLPPLNIQEEIVKACQKVDDEVLEANETIEQSDKEIMNLIQNAQIEKTIKLGDTCELKAGKFVSASDINDEDGKDLYPCYGGNGLRGYVKTFTHEGTYPLIGRQGALCGNITLVHGKFYATEHAVAVTPKIDLEIIWLYHKLVIMNINQYKTGTAQPGLSVKNIINVNIELPSLETQKEIVSKIEILETKIDEAKKVIEGAKALKEEVLRKYL